MRHGYWNIAGLAACVANACMSSSLREALGWIAASLFVAGLAADELYQHMEAWKRSRAEEPTNGE